jgi:cytoskeletal protein CcmA (bactofilin family)
MFNRDGIFGKKDETPARGNEPRPVNVTPGLSGGGPVTRPQGAEPSKQPEVRYAEPPKSAPREEQTTGSRLIVGPDIKLKGVEITDCDTLVVEGRVEASMDSRVVQIAEAGVFSGTVSIDVAEIRGRFEGELTARKQLVIYSTGRVAGRIRYGKIRIEEGGEVSGEVSTLTGVTSSTRQASSSPSTAGDEHQTATSADSRPGRQPSKSSSASTI